MAKKRGGGGSNVGLITTLIFFILATIGLGVTTYLTTDIAAMIRSVLRRPRELPALLRTALDARAARATMIRGRRLLGPGLGLPRFQSA